jgi:hypothetical protein
MPPDFLVPIAGMATGLILLLPIVRAIVRITEKKLTGGGDAGDLLAIRDEIRLIHDRLDRVEDGDERLAELEERLDFAERLLARQQHQQIDPGQGV